MIARLRKRFILITMGSVILVLLVLMGVVNAANFLKTDQAAGELLQILADNGGDFPDRDDPDRPPGPDAGADRHSDLSPEVPYETRYFSVELKADGTLSAVNTGRIAAVSAEEAVAMAQALQEDGKTSGYTGSYKYLAAGADSGTLYIFLDCTRDLSSVRAFFVTSLLVSLCGILAVFLLVVALSKRAVRPVAESYEKQKQFITNAGHELRTPLAVIDSCAEVLALEQGESKWTEGIRSQVRRLDALTQDLVSLARMDEGSVKPVMEEFSLSDAVTEALEPFLLLAGKNGLRPRTEIQPGIRCRGSEKLLRQLCAILADNAVKYALPDSEIRFSLKKKGKKAVLTVQNAAEGLQAGDQSILFDRFYRGDASRSSEKSGYGIGLSLAQSIAAVHGGTISAGSEDGASLTVTVQLPCAGAGAAK